MMFGLKDEVTEETEDWFWQRRPRLAQVLAEGRGVSRATERGSLLAGGSAKRSYAKRGGEEC